MAAARYDQDRLGVVFRASPRQVSSQSRFHIWLGGEIKDCVVDVLLSCTPCSRLPRLRSLPESQRNHMTCIITTSICLNSFRLFASHCNLLHSTTRLGSPLWHLESTPSSHIHPPLDNPTPPSVEYYTLSITNQTE